ncbi:MAG TPA: ABC transporter ATP-binding protein [Thermoplasmata archaeon]|nr:ABC transporter ATP-binding protein [Thermoplasmata archaeon]
MSVKLRFERVTKRFGKRLVADDITLDVDTGEFFVILGPSGEGKSTLLRMVAGIEQLDAGRIWIDGQDVTYLAPNKRNIAMVFQNYALYPNMNVFRNIAFPLKMQYFPREEIEPKVRDVAKTLGITEILDRRVNQISGGQQQRVALARAIVRNPTLFLLDEPLSNLDARVRFAARAELKKIQKDLGQTFLFVTHDQKEAETLSDRTGVIHLGRFEQVGPFSDLYERPATRWIGDFVGDVPMNYMPWTESGAEGSLGFRPEWAEVSPEGAESATVQVSERVGDFSYLLCTMANGWRIYLRSLRSVDAGTEVRFNVNRHVFFQTPQAAESAAPMPPSGRPERLPPVKP